MSINETKRSMDYICMTLGYISEEEYCQFFIDEESVAIWKSIFCLRSNPDDLNNFIIIVIT